MNIESKFLRYLELSRKFEKSESKIFEESDSLLGKDEDSIYLTTDSGCFTYCGGNEEEQQKPKTRAQKYKENVKEYITLAKEYDEYKELQKQLEEYLTAKDKLNK